MSMTVDDFIATTKQRATTADALAGLKTVVTVTNMDEAFALALEEACLQGGIDFAFAFAHGANECDYYRDDDYVRDHNAFGIGHPDGATGGIVFESKRACARFYVGEMLLKLRLPIPVSLSDARSYAPMKWDQVERIVAGSHGPFPLVSIIDDLNTRFGPNNREAVWMTDPLGPQAIVAKGNRLFPNLPEQEGTKVPELTRPAVVLDAGHRSTDRSGNPAEMAMTDDLARAYRSELKKRGYEAYWYQEDIDRDADPDETIGDLNTVAKGLGAWLRTKPWALMLSLHYNGAHSPLHAIVPDNVGLSTAYPEGRDPNDTAAKNPLDCYVGNRIVVNMNAAGLGSVFNGKLSMPGVMSETETGVGLQGFRLAVMAATASSRTTAVRLIIEHGGTSDAASHRFADLAKASADALDSVYGTGGGTTTTTTTAPPEKPLRLPKGMSSSLAGSLFNPSKLKKPDGRAIGFTMTGELGKAWLRHVLASNPAGKIHTDYDWPALTSVTKRGDGRIVYAFSDGWVHEQAAPS